MLYVSKLFLCFIMLSFLGWCLEVLYGRVVLKKFVNRGFLIGPLCPLYGVGGVLLYLLLRGYAKDPIMLMLASMAICSILEYLTSFVMEKMFKTRWWDYSNMKFNINGRICLEMIIPFGLLGLLVVYFVFPTALNLLNKLPDLAIYITTSLLFTILLVDMAVSFKIIFKFTKAMNFAPKDMTEEISKFVRNTLEKPTKLARRLIDSFPNLSNSFDSIRDKLFPKNEKK